jgi:hypothetical protein
MMSEPKPIASLSSMLLARKGQASPAMRRQNMMALADLEAVEPSALEDLGWNDMGVECPVESSSSGGFAGLSPMAPSPVALVTDDAAVPHPIANAPVPFDAPVPMVVHQQRELVEEFQPVEAQYAEAHYAEARPAEATPVFEAPAPSHGVTPAPVRSAVPRALPGARNKAAFTLRLDADRHLKLRLVCALNHRSAQQIVTAALDAFLENQPVPADLTDFTTRHRGVN